MPNRLIITIAGKPGSGKSTTSKAVAKNLNYEHFSSGDLFRSVASERGLDVKTANHQAESESSIDDLVDAKLQEIGKTQNELVIDSRTAWHWMPDSFKVYLDLDLAVAAERIINELHERKNANEIIPESKEQYIVELQERLDSESKRYQTLYGINPYNTSNYDLVVDTAENDIDSVIAIIVEEFKKWSAANA